MPVLKPRERLVYFRISEDEYRQFTSVCEQAGARSVSDLARNAVQRLIADGQRDQHEERMEEKLRVLERLIEEMKQQLKALGINSANDNLALDVAGAAPAYLQSASHIDHNGQKES
jgi:DNA-binding transcriptional regulator GbsR (MarR family)